MPGFVDIRNELNILLGLLPKTSDPLHAIQVIQTTSRWLRGRSDETFWDDYNDSREWDEDDSRRGLVKDYDPGRWNSSRYSLPIEIRVRLGIQHLSAKNLPEAMVPPSPPQNPNVPLIPPPIACHIVRVWYIVLIRNRSNSSS